MFRMHQRNTVSRRIAAVKAIGRSAKYVNVSRVNDGKMLNTDEEQIKRDFVESIDKSYPVLSRRMNNHRYNIVIGYEDDGRKIVCKEAVDERGCHRVAETFVYENWENDILDYIVLKELLEPAPERQRIPYISATSIRIIFY